MVQSMEGVSRFVMMQLGTVLAEQDFHNQVTTTVMTLMNVVDLHLHAVKFVKILLVHSNASVIQDITQPAVILKIARKLTVEVQLLSSVLAHQMLTWITSLQFAPR